MPIVIISLRFARRIGSQTAGILCALVLLAGCGNQTQSKIEDAAGDNATCEKIGLMLVAGEREHVWECTDKDTAAPEGCYVYVDGSATDVSSQVEALGRLSGQYANCY